MVEMSAPAVASVDAAQTFIHRIDAADFIRYVSPTWNAFGEQNEAKHLIGTVVGNQLWRYIGGLEVRRIYRALLERIRADRRPVQFPFRCDSATLRRHMVMRVTALADGGVEFQSSLVREERRPRLALLDPAMPRSDRQVVLCAWCKRVDRHGRWYELEEALQTNSFFDSPRPPHVNHEICPHCREIIK
jgi:hypothetical protein